MVPGQRLRGRIAVVAALPEEVAPLIRRLGERRPGPRQQQAGGRSGGWRPRRLASGALGDWQVTVAVTGVGRRATERAADGLLDGPSPAAVRESGALALVMVVGVAGGLTPGLAAGSLVVASEVVDEEGLAPPPDPAWLDKALARPGVVAGRVVTVERVAASAAEKAVIRGRLGGGGIGVVDLESAVWARAAGRRGVPCLIVRAVSDAADESLPLDFEALRGPGGELSRVTVAVRALRHPRSLAALWRLRGRVRRCAGELARVVEGVLT